MQLGMSLDFDGTDEPRHGHYEGRFFHGYYDGYCFLPLYVFCGDQLLVSYSVSHLIDWIFGAIVERVRQQKRVEGE